MVMNLRGVLASLVASCLFGFLYYYATLLKPLAGTEVYGWRMLTCAPFLTFAINRSGYWSTVLSIVRKARHNVLFALCLTLSAFLFGIQLWLFLWAPNNGMALQVSLGYLLMPLVMVIIGRYFFHDTLKLYHKVAIFFAGVGISNQIYQLGSVSFEALVVALGFPAYFALRKVLKTDNIAGLWVDILLSLPVALYFSICSDRSLSFFIDRPIMIFAVFLLGIITTLSYLAYMLASQTLSLSVFGLLGYVEPILLVGVSLLIGERISFEEALTYCGVFLAILTLAIGSYRQSIAFSSD